MARRALLRAGCRPSVNARHIAERTRLLEGLALSTAFPGPAAGFRGLLGFDGVCVIARQRTRCDRCLGYLPCSYGSAGVQNHKPNGSRLGAVRLSDWRVSKSIKKKNGSRLGAV